MDVRAGDAVFAIDEGPAMDWGEGDFIFWVSALFFWRGAGLTLSSFWLLAVKQKQRHVYSTVFTHKKTNPPWTETSV